MTLGQSKREGHREGHIGVGDANTDEKKHLQVVGIEGRIELNYELRAEAPGPVALLCIHS